MRASPSIPVKSPDRVQLLDLARTAIADSLHANRRLPAPTAAWSAPLSQRAASFVTLSINGALRGCCGSIEPSQPLADDVWCNAQRTAFQDPRFPALRASEARGTLLEISVLGALQRLPVTCEQELLSALRPGVDGLLLTCGAQRATFLPKVWEKLPDPSVFLVQLKRKLGVADDFWDDALVAERYATQEFGGMLLAGPQTRRSVGE